MKQPKTECPACNHLESFPHRFSDARTPPDVIEVYIACTTCNWHQHVGYTTKEIEKADRKLTKARNKERKERERNGQASRATMATFDRLLKRSIDLKVDLQERLGKHGVIKTQR